MKNFKVNCQNVRGLKSKLHLLQEIINNYQPSVVFIIETHAKRGRNPKTRLWSFVP